MTGKQGFDDVLCFWFEELKPEQHFVKDTVLDARIKERFESLYWQIIACEKDFWRDEPEGRLAEVIVLDQFSRNIFRGQAQAFAADPLALALAQEAVRAGADQSLENEKRPFLYMPFMHSESPLIHETALKLFVGFEANYRFECAHKEIIDRFGRYPHRNEALGRTSSAEEISFFKEHSGF